MLVKSNNVYIRNGKTFKRLPTKIGETYKGEIILLGNSTSWATKITLLSEESNEKLFDIDVIPSQYTRKLTTEFTKYWEKAQYSY